MSDGEEILITSSGSAVALVSHETGATLFYASVKNAHSADLLPGGFIAVIGSWGGMGQQTKCTLGIGRRKVVVLPH